MNRPILAPERVLQANVYVRDGATREAGVLSFATPIEAIWAALELFREDPGCACIVAIELGSPGRSKSVPARFVGELTGLQPGVHLTRVTLLLAIDPEMAEVAGCDQLLALPNDVDVGDQGIDGRVAAALNDQFLTEIDHQLLDLIAELGSCSVDQLLRASRREIEAALSRLLAHGLISLKADDENYSAIATLQAIAKGSTAYLH